MKKSVFLIYISFLLVLLHSCKKDKKDPPKDTGGQYTTTDVKVVLPIGTNLDLSKTKIFTMTQISNVGVDGSAKVPFVTNGCELAFLLDASDNLLMMGYIYEGNKELSIKSTALALLYHGLGLNFLPDTTRQLFLAKNNGNVRLNNYFTKIEQAFKTDVQMLEKRTFTTALTEAVNMITDVKPLDIYAKQMDVVDDDIRSEIQIEKVDDDNVKINNSSYRRAYAFIYKTAFRDINNQETVLINNIDYDDAAMKDQKVEKVKYVKNVLDIYGQYYSKNPAVTGPINLPISSNEKEVTYKLRIIGPGKPGATLTNAEKTKLDELYDEYLAFNMLAPFFAEAVGVSSNYSIDENNLSAYLQKTKSIAALDPEIMQRLKDGRGYNGIPRMFFDAMDKAGINRDNIINSFMDGFRKQFPNGQFPSGQNITDANKLIDKGLNLLEYLTGTISPKFILISHEFYNIMEEFTVKIKDNDVKISPRKSDVMAFTNHPLTVTANPSLSSGESIEYEWITTGTFGVLKNGSTEGTTFTTTANTINFYGKSTPNDVNIETVIVKAYLKNSNGAKTIYGSDTAYIDVKKVKIILNPTGVSLSPSNGYSSVKLYLKNADGTNPIVNNSQVQYRVKWSTSGSYGYFEDGVKQANTTDNSIIYIATDDQIKTATENITAVVEFKLNSTGWMLREIVKGTVKISNDTKTIVYYASPTAVHRNVVNACGVGCVLLVKKVPNAISYNVEITGLSNPNYPTYSDTWAAGDPNHVRGYGYALYKEEEAGDDYIIGITGTVSWSGGGPDYPITEHFPLPQCSGIAKVTVTVSQ